MEDLVDKGDYYEIKDYKPLIFELDTGQVALVHCPYIPKFLVDGPVMVSTG